METEFLGEYHHNILLNNVLYLTSYRKTVTLDPSVIWSPIRLVMHKELFKDEASCGALTSVTFGDITTYALTYFTSAARKMCALRLLSLNHPDVLENIRKGMVSNVVFLFKYLTREVWTPTEDILLVKIVKIYKWRMNSGNKSYNHTSKVNFNFNG